MTRKDYVLMAETIKARVDHAKVTIPGPIEKLVVLEALKDLAQHLAYELMNDNGAFDYNRFIEACGVEQ